MINIINNINEIEALVRDLEKIESKLINGQEILAYRDLGRVLAKLRKAKDEIIESEIKDG
jgi:hypothetical protein